MDRYERLVEKVADLEAHLKVLKAEMRQYAEDTDRVRVDDEARRRRRGMHSLAIIPAAVGTLATAAKQQSPVASAAVALTASAIIGAMVVTHPGGGGVRDTEPGVIAGQRPPAPTAEALPPRDLRRPEGPSPVSVRPPRTAPAPRPPPKAQAKVQTVDLAPVRAPTRRPDTAPMRMRETVNRPSCVVRVVVVRDLHVRLRCR